MSGNSIYFGNDLENWLKGAAMPAAPTQLYLALFNGDPTDAGTGGVEVTATIRPAGRVPVTYGAVATKSMSNNAAVNFGAAQAQAQITHFSIWDSPTPGQGNMYGSNPLTSGAGTIGAGTTVNFPVGSLTWME